MGAAHSPGQALAVRFYRHEVAPLLGGAPHAAALLGDGSEVLGYDDEVSTDHDFGPRVQLFLSPAADPALVHAALTGLPERFEGYPVVFGDTDRYGGRPHHQVDVTTVEAFFRGILGTGVRQFHDRDIRVVGAERFTEALTAAITDTEVRGLLARLGQRGGATVGALPGAIDQAVDSVDVLSHPARCRAAAAMLGLA